MYCIKCGNRVSEYISFCSSCGSITDNDTVKKEISYFAEKLVYNESRIMDCVFVLKDIITRSGADDLNDIFIFNDKACLLKEVAELIKLLESVLSVETKIRRSSCLNIYDNDKKTLPFVSFYIESREECISEVKEGLSEITSVRKYMLEAEILSEDSAVNRVIEKTSLVLEETEEIYRELDRYLNDEKNRVEAFEMCSCPPIEENDRFDYGFEYGMEQNNARTAVGAPIEDREKCGASKRRGIFSRISSLFEKKDKKKDKKKDREWSTRVEQINNILRNTADEDSVDYSISIKNEAEDRTPEIEPVVISEVQFSAIVKKKAELSEYIPVNIIMYEEEFRTVVEERLDETVKETKSGYHNVSMQSKIKVVLSSKDIELDDCEEEGVWQGKFLEFGFIAEVPENYAKKQILFCASVYVNDLIATKLKFFVDVRKEEEHKVDVAREDIKSAFVSYASQDRERVASIVQGMEKARPDLDVFFDVETLRSGENWKETLKTEIDKRTVLFLCWSKFASQSEWVDFEWRYALDKKGSDYIDPVPIEPPEICPPPEELSAKHFNDRMIYMIKALEYMNKDKPCLIIKETNEKIYVNKNSFIIGRLKGRADYIAQNKKVGRIHAEIICEEGKYFIIDLNSINKTYVDGKECAPEERTPIYDGTMIMLADMELIFKLPERE